MENKETAPYRHLPKGNRVANAFIYIALIIVVQLPTSAAIIFLPLSFNLDSYITVIVSIVLLIVACLMAWAIHTYYLARGYTQPKQKFRWKDIGINILLLVITLLSSMLHTWIMTHITKETTTQNQQQINSSLNSFLEGNHLPHPSIVIVTVLFIVIFAPYVEEHIFRGIFRETLFKPVAFWLPFILSAIIFSLAHGISSPVSFSLYFIMGLIFYLAYKRRGNIRDSMMVHMLNNLIATLPMLIAYISLYFK